MAPTGTLLAVLLLAPAQGPKELVALPLSEDGVKPPAGLDAWKVVTAELKRSGRLGMSMALQKKQHDFLIGPAREQARDCGSNMECLAEIGAALKADVLVAGTVDATSVSLVAVDVKAATKLGSSRSSKKLAKASIKRRASSAARMLIEAIGTGTPPPPPPVAVVEDPARLPPPPSDAPPPPVVATAEAPSGELHIGKDQLTGVAEVKVDGETLLFAGDGSMIWKGTPGTHSLVAVHADGNRVSKDVVIDQDKTTEVTLEFAATTASTEPPKAEEEKKDDSFLTAWWFWTSIGAAVAAGATTAALLAAGTKGGPDLEGDTGTIRGRY